MGRPTAPADANPPPSLRRAKPASVSLATEFVSWWWNDPLPPPPEYKGDPFLTLGERFGRPARVVLPNAYNETHRVYPLVLVLHGWKSNGDYHDFYLGVSARASDPRLGGFIAVIPNGTWDAVRQSRFWNAGTCCDYSRSNVDDEKYLTGLMDEAHSKYRVDSEEIYVVGHSNGGLMAQVLGCHHSHTFKGFVSISPGIIPINCSSTTVKKVLMVAGTEDVFFSVQDGYSNMGQWGRHLGCPSTATEEGETRDYDCIVNAPAGIDSWYNYYRDRNCQKTGTYPETSILAWDACGRRNDAKQALWLMEKNTHNPAFNDRFSHDILKFLLAE
ncbi:hypothetical protein NSK_005655 [Nannochloropsis salina CCMP1776]|uniref:Phospholipase/carboxylesterase/thioesterase domain-containing protein n=1 Tax=Nannochloropsis salina CCMP1776 TaxID=1027361 RepID=A0A4D9CUY5_9STRA|nr:hypothetical protein NSK_005655 [Nannochloropsis salina CCMP1776]|eukprot:TFJ83030.1 hypothetical protein NSK_005655 [Nannochloropsis salina CCMP1776]